MENKIAVGEKVKIVSEGSIYNGKIGILGAKAPDLPAHNVYFYNGSFDTFMDYEFISIEKEIPTMKEKLEKVLGNFIKRNKEYVIEIYVKNGKTGNMIAKILFNKMYCILEKEKCIVDKDVVGTHGTQIILPYVEIMDCYEERDEYNQQTVYVILKNSMIIEFECCGERI